MRWPWRRREPELYDWPQSEFEKMLRRLAQGPQKPVRIEWLDDMLMPKIETRLWCDWRWVE